MLIQPPPRVVVHLTKLSPHLMAGAAGYLPIAELRRAGEIRNARQRLTFVASHRWLRELLARELPGSLPVEVPIVEGPNGKPRLACGEIEFSVSHCEEWCAIAMSRDCPVGVDVEVIQPMDGIGEVVREFFPPVARAAVAAAPAKSVEEFYRWWTRLEAALKASGQGLDSSASCLDGVAVESCDSVPGIALAVAARTPAGLFDALIQREQTSLPGQDLPVRMNNSPFAKTSKAPKNSPDRSVI